MKGGGLVYKRRGWLMSLIRLMLAIAEAKRREAKKKCGTQSSL